MKKSKLIILIIVLLLIILSIFTISYHLYVFLFKGIVKGNKTIYNVHVNLGEVKFCG